MRIKALTIICVLVLHQLTMAADSNPKEDERWSGVIVKGKEKWFFLNEIKKSSDVYLLKQEPELKLEKFDVTAIIIPDDSVEMVTFKYFENFGVPVYHVTINKHGQVISFKKKIATEGSSIR